MNIQEKIQTRSEALNKLENLNSDDQLNWDKKIATNLITMLEKFSSSWKLQYGIEPILGSYLPLPGEPQVLSLLSEKFKNQCFPVRRDHKLMGYVPYEGNLQELSKESYFLKNEGHKICNPDIILVPGLMFDRKGFRLGRGRGYFDVYLATHGCLSIGLCYSWQLVKALPIEAHDEKVTMIITENEILRISKNDFLNS